MVTEDVRRVGIDFECPFVLPLSGIEIPLIVEIVVRQLRVAFGESVIKFHRLECSSLSPLRNSLGPREHVKAICKTIAAGKPRIRRRITWVFGNGFPEILQALACALLVVSFQEITRPEIRLPVVRVRCRFALQPVLLLRRNLNSYLVGDGLRYFAFYLQGVTRSEERRVGKECRSRWSPYH